MPVEMASIAPAPVKKDPDALAETANAAPAGPERVSCAWRASYVLSMYPCAIASGLLLVFFLLCVPASDAGSKMASSNNNDWTVLSDPTTDNDMWNDARARTAPADPDRVVKPRSQMSTVWGAVNYLYSWADDAVDPDADIFTPENVQQMCELERIFIDRAGYEDFCILEYPAGANTSSTCAPIRMSAARLFYAAMFVNQTMDCSGIQPCNAVTKSFKASGIKAMLPVPTTYVNPATPDTKYWVTSMPGTPSALFNFTDTQGGAARPGRREDGDPLGKGYALGGKGACPLLPDWHVKAVREWLYTTVALPSVVVGPLNTTGEQLLGFFMDKDMLTRGKTLRTRSMVAMGSPLDGYTDSGDRGKEQNDKIKEFVLLGEPQLFDKFGMVETAGKMNPLLRSPYLSDPETEQKMDVDWFSMPTNQNEFSRMLGGDFLMVIFSILFVSVWIMVHTWSVFIGGMGMLQILLSLPVTYTVYSLFVPYFSQMHILATFLVLGVGADDVFVLTDGWKQSVRDVIPVPGETRRERLQRRMAYAYGRTASAVFNTSFTTAMAFVSTAISPIMTISAFGAFAAIAILVNYVMVVTWLPAIILAAEIHIWPRCNKLCKTKCFKWGPQDDAAWSDLSAIDDTGVPVEEESVSCIDKAFEKGYGKCMIKHTCEKRLRGSAEADAADGARPLTCSVCRFRPFATLSFVAILAWAIVMVYWTLQLSPPTKAEAFFPDAHMSTGITDLMSDAYLGGGSDSYTGGVFFVGLEKLDRENKGTSDIPFNKYDPDYNRGSVEFDPDFDLYPTANQDYLVGFCDKLDKKVCHEDGDAGKPKLEACTGANQLLVRQGSLECFIREFHKWHEAEFNGTQANDNTAVTRSEFKERLLRFRKSEVPNTGGAGASWKNSIGVLKDAKTGEQEIKYVSFAFTSTMAKRRPIGIKQPLYDMTEKMISEFVADAPKGLTHMGQSFGHQGWVWMETEKALVAGLMNGLAICFPIAFLVLAVATRNLILSVIATLSIGFIVASVLGSVKLFYGWDLGIAETIAGIIVIGFSVDYVVHMGHMYIEASEKSGAMTREKRFYYAASKMGSTVMAGAITTAGSGAFMFVCQMRFFYKMAILITMTIGYSFVFSFGFFMAFLVIAGPEYDESNLGVPCGLSLVKEAAHIMNDRKKAMKQLRNARGLDDDAKTAGLMEGGSDAPKTAAEDDDDDGELNGDEIRGWKANAAKNGKASI